MSYERGGTGRGWLLLAGAAGIVAIGGIGHSRAENDPGCVPRQSNIASYALCGFGFGSESEAAAAAVPTTAPAQAPLETTTTVDADPFNLGWYTDPASGAKTMIVDERFPVVFQHDPQWKWPAPMHSGCACSFTDYSTGYLKLTGQFISPVEMYQKVIAASGGQRDGCGAEESDRALIAGILGLKQHEFNKSLQAAEEFARTVDPNVFVIIGQFSDPNIDIFSPYVNKDGEGDHVIGLFWDEEVQAWRAADPNDFYKNADGQHAERLAKEPELADIKKFYKTDQIPQIYHAVGWTGDPAKYKKVFETQAA